MAIDKLIPQYLNSDTDQKLVKSVEMTDNLNIRVSNDDEGTAGVLKNVKGNVALSERRSTDALPTGDNKVIGVAENEKNKEIIFLVWNSNSNHGIYRLDLTTNKYQKLYQDSVLNLKKFSYAACNVIVNEENETLFYWTDDVNPPMKVNVNRLAEGRYPSALTSGTNEEKLLCLTVAKQRPLRAPSFSMVRNSSLEKNNIREKHFQFAYRYKYADGEVSALSEWSSFTFATTQVKSSFLAISDDAIDFYNQINVFVRNSKADVEKITVFARELNSETFFEVEELDNNFTDNAVTINFTDSKRGSALSLDEVNKSYDNVPQLAKAQTITGNRLMYGNYTEGYENINVDVTASPAYRESEKVYTIKAYVEDNSKNYYYELNNQDSSNHYEIKLDFSELPSTVEANSFINIEFILVTETFKAIAFKNQNHNQLRFNFKPVDKDELSQKLLDNMVFFAGSAATGTQEEYLLPIKNVIFKHTYRTSVQRTKAQTITNISNGLVAKTFTGIVDADKAETLDGHVYDSRLTPTLTGKAQARVWLEGIASFKLSHGSLVSDVKTFRLKFAGATVSVKAAEILDYDLLPVLGFPTYPVPVEIISAPRQKIGGIGAFNINTAYPETKTAKYGVSGIAGSSSYLADTLDGYSSFKSDANHSFGIVYYDDRGRAGGVNELDPVFIKPLWNRDDKGGSVVDFRVKHTAPDWAKRWQLVYAGNNNVDKFLQYTTGSGLIPKDEDEYLSQSVYVSMNTLEGTSNSYREGEGARLEYKYKEGDRLKVVRYTDSLGNYVYPENHEFKVIGYEKLTPDEDKFLGAKGFDYQNNKGYAIKLENVDKAGFGFDFIKQGNSLWENNTVVEIFSPLREAREKVYYGVGKSYGIDGSQHEGERAVDSQQTATITIDGSGGATGSDRLYVGDRLNVGGTIIEITSVTIKVDGTYAYKYSGSVAAAASASYNIVNYLDAIAVANRGDVFFRARRLITRNDEITKGINLGLNWDENAFDVFVGFIEDESISDFYKSDGFTRNKPYAPIPDSRTIRRLSSITYSDAYVIDSDRLNLSSFNLSLANWKDIDLIYGSVTSLVARGDALTAIQESKVSQIPVGKNIIEFSSGNANVTASKNVLGNAQYYAGDYGTSNPESVVERFGVVYFVDTEASKVIRLSSDGITPISDKGMDSFFEERFRDIKKNAVSIQVIGGFDPRNGEYLITVQPVYTSTVTIGDIVNDIPANADSDLVFNMFGYTSQTVIWNIWGNLWNTFCGNWEDVGNGVVFVDSAFNVSGVLLDAALSGSTSTVNVLITDSQYSFSAIGTLNLSTNKLTMPAQTCEGTNITVANSTAQDAGFTISYKHKEGVWGSKYSFMPTMYANVNNDLFSFFENDDDDLVWHHDENSTRNKFYNTQYNSVFEVVSNRNPSMVKVFEAIAIEGNGDWSGTLTTDDQSTSVSTGSFDEREGHKYAMIPRDSLSSKSHEIYLGEVESIDSSTNEVTFTTPINRIPFVIGDALQTVVGGTKTNTGTSITDVTGRKTIKCGSVSNIAVGNDVMVSHTASVDGDAMRGVFLKCKMTSANTTAFEVHALSLSYDRSRLHNDRVN